MLYFAWFLILYGAFLLIGYILHFPFLYNNLKSKMMIKKMGIKWFNVLLVFMGALLIAIGIVILP